jgi:uncharacterized RDD family membrane protein YckC/tetratricopeptide (TPR) repeat protein
MTYIKASKSRRFFSSLIDLAVSSLFGGLFQTFYASAHPIESQGDVFRILIYSIFAAFLFWSIFPVIVGTTVGKLAFDLEVAPFDKDKSTGAVHTFLRYFITYFLWLIAGIFVLLNKNRRHTGDSISNTIVLQPSQVRPFFLSFMVGVVIVTSCYFVNFRLRNVPFKKNPIVSAAQDYIVRHPEEWHSSYKFLGLAFQKETAIVSYIDDLKNIKYLYLQKPGLEWIITYNVNREQSKMAEEKKKSDEAFDLVVKQVESLSAKDLIENAHIKLDTYFGEDENFVYAEAAAKVLEEKYHLKNESRVLYARMQLQSAYYSGQDYNLQEVSEVEKLTLDILHEDPNNYMANLNLMKIYDIRDEQVSAKEMRLKLESLDIKNMHYRFYTLDKDANKKPNEEIDGYLTFLKDFPKLGYEAKVYNLLSVTYRNLKDYTEAEKYFKLILSERPNNTWNKINYAGLLNWEHREDETILMLQPIFKNEDFSLVRRLLADAYNQKAEKLFYHLNKEDEAKIYFEKVIDLDPKRENAVYCLASYYWFNFEKLQKEDDYQKAKRLSENYIKLVGDKNSVQLTFIQERLAQRVPASFK